MTRLILGEVLDDGLEEVLAEHRERNDTRELLFSDLAVCLCDVVLEFCPSPNQAYLDHQEQLNVSKTAFDNKLNHVGTSLSRGIVQHSDRLRRQMLEEMDVPRWSYLPGYHTKTIDGNAISAGDNRLSELRKTWQKALLGKSVVVMDADRQLIQDVFPLEDGHAQEPMALDGVLATIEKNDLIFTDRAYCTIKFLSGIAGASACFVIRQHGALPGELVGRRKACGESETGRLFGQALGIGGSVFRRVTLELFGPTADGDTVIHVLTNLPAGEANAATVADLYRLQWEIEYKFYLAQMALRCEVKTLNYAKANLFVFCLALLALNCRQVLFGVFEKAFAEEIEQEVSADSVSVEVARSFDGLMTAVDEASWQEQIPRTFAGRMTFLIRVASHFDRQRHRKSVRGVKKPPPEKSTYRNGHHLSIPKILNARSPTRTRGKPCPNGVIR